MKNINTGKEKNMKFSELLKERLSKPFKQLSPIEQNREIKNELANVSFLADTLEITGNLDKGKLNILINLDKAFLSTIIYKMAEILNVSQMAISATFEKHGIFIQVDKDKS